MGDREVMLKAVFYDVSIKRPVPEDQISTNSKLQPCMSIAYHENYFALFARFLMRSTNCDLAVPIKIPNPIAIRQSWSIILVERP